MSLHYCKIFCHSEPCIAKPIFVLRTETLRDPTVERRENKEDRRSTKIGGRRAEDHPSDEEIIKALDEAFEQGKQKLIRKFYDEMGFELPEKMR